MAGSSDILLKGDGLRVVAPLEYAPITRETDAGGIVLLALFSTLNNQDPPTVALPTVVEAVTSCDL